MNQLIFEASLFAAQAHHGQTRKGLILEPYVLHCLRVGKLADLAGLTQEEIAAAILHDTVEDTNTTPQDLQNRFPSRTVQVVHLLTKWWGDSVDSDPTMAANKARYYSAILADPAARVIKLLDRADNLSDMARMCQNCGVGLAKWAKRYNEKTEREFAPFMPGIKEGVFEGGATALDFAVSLYNAALAAAKHAVEAYPWPPRIEHSAATAQRETGN